MTLNEPDLQSPAQQKGYPYWKEIFGDLSPEKVEKEIPPTPDPFDQPNKQMGASTPDPAWYVQWKKTSPKAKPWFADWKKSSGVRVTAERQLDDMDRDRFHATSQRQGIQSGFKQLSLSSNDMAGRNNVFSKTKENVTIPPDTPEGFQYKERTLWGMRKSHPGLLEIKIHFPQRRNSVNGESMMVVRDVITAA